MTDARENIEPAAPSTVVADTPSRYLIVETEDERYLRCSSAANLQLHFERDMTVNDGARRNFPRQSIFLDGVYMGAPFIDNKARQYSLDHHAGVVRSITLATCEQAAVMLLDGLPLAEGNWHIYGNEPDLDAVLAAWILLNHTQMLKDDGELLRAAMPLIRVEGVIDAHGLDHSILSGLSEDVYSVQKRALDTLMEVEQELKASGSWKSTDPLQYVRVQLDQLDRLYLTDDYLQRLLEVEELGTVPIEAGRVGILCRATRGIYDAEMTLKERYGAQLGVIVLRKEQGHYTLRQVDSFLHHTLVDAYAILNRLDSCADARNGNLWGGANDIGGSPRATGSGLSSSQVMEAIKEAYRSRGWLRELWRRLTG